MDFRTVVIISTLLLMTADADKTLGPNIRETSLPAQTVSNIIKCSCPSATPAATASPTPSISSSVSFFGVIQVRWKSKCEGDLIFYNLSISLPVCNISNKFIDDNLLMNLFENKKDCKMLPQFDKDRVRRNCFHISESGAEQRTGCETLIVKCKDVPDVKQLQAYKAVTALLCCVLLLLLVIRFTRPTVKALQKRLSDRRQNRWIGPTQSHSVSYHRGKTAVKNNDGEKRLSYPALERLAVSDSREPSSNRNSDYNF